MRYVVLGCGAIGGTVAAGLARDGHDVLVSDADRVVVQIRFHQADGGLDRVQRAAPGPEQLDAGGQANLASLAGDHQGRNDCFS